MAVTITDSATAAAINAAGAGTNGTREEGIVDALKSPFSTSSVTVEVRSSAGTLLKSSTHGAWTKSVSGGTAKLTLGSKSAESHSATGTPASVRFKTAAGTEIFRCSAGVGSGDISFLANIGTESVTWSAVEFTAPDLDTSGSPVPAGEALIVAVAGDFDAVKPSGWSSANWKYAIFGSYGSGVFNEHASASGKFQQCFTGGHGHPSIFGRLQFDYSDFTWSYAAATGQADDDGAGISSGAMSSDDWLEMTASSVPAVAHLYRSLIPLAPANGGASGGTLLVMGRKAVNSAATGTSNRVHKVNFTAGTISRVSPSGAGFPINVYEMTALDSPADNRVYLLEGEIWNRRYVQYLDLADMTIKDTSAALYPYCAGPAISPASPATYPTFFLHSRLIVWTFGGELRALDLDDITTGWQDLTVSGDALPSTVNAWTFHETQGVFYHREDAGGQDVLKLTPPVSPLSGTWVCSTVTLTGDTVPDSTDTGHYRRLHYVPDLDCLGWIASDGVVTLLNPV